MRAEVMKEGLQVIHEGCNLRVRHHNIAYEHDTHIVLYMMAVSAEVLLTPINCSLTPRCNVDKWLPNYIHRRTSKRTARPSVNREPHDKMAAGARRLIAACLFARKKSHHLSVYWQAGRLSLTKWDNDDPCCNHSSFARSLGRKIPCTTFGFFYFQFKGLKHNVLLCAKEQIRHRHDIEVSSQEDLLNHSCTITCSNFNGSRNRSIPWLIQH